MTRASEGGAHGRNGTRSGTRLIHKKYTAHMCRSHAHPCKTSRPKYGSHVNFTRPRRVTNRDSTVSNTRDYTDSTACTGSCSTRAGRAGRAALFLHGFSTVFSTVCHGFTVFSRATHGTAPVFHGWHGRTVDTAEMCLFARPAGISP